MEGPADIVERIRREVRSGTAIPKPRSTEPHVVKGWGTRRGESALIYLVPNRRDPSRPYEKGVNETEWRLAWERLKGTGVFSRAWFRKSMPACNSEGGCNFTAIGGVFQLLGEARHQHGEYLSKAITRVESEASRR